MKKETSNTDKTKAINYEPLLGCVCELSHVERKVLSMSKEELEASRKEIMKNTETVNTGFGDIILIKHPFLNAP